jgi:HSP20 family protein
MSFFNKLKKNIKTEKEPLKSSSTQSEQEGELSVDVFETEDDLVVRSTIAGVKAKDINVSVENSVLTIRGKRKKPSEDDQRKYLYQECYWGGFYRQIILPASNNAKIVAKMKDGVLTLIIPKTEKRKKKKISIKDEG